MKFSSHVLSINKWGNVHCAFFMFWKKNYHNLIFSFRQRYRQTTFFSSFFCASLTLHLLYLSPIWYGIMFIYNIYSDLGCLIMFSPAWNDLMVEQHFSSRHLLLLMFLSFYTFIFLLFISKCFFFLFCFSTFIFIYFGLCFVLNKNKKKKKK